MGKTKSSNELLLQYYKEKLSSDPAWVERAIVKLYEYQTNQEKVDGTTHENNGVGFSGGDAAKMTYYAKWIKSGNHLSGDFLEDALKRTSKYAKQLISISDPNTLQKILDRIC